MSESENLQETAVVGAVEPAFDAPGLAARGPERQREGLPPGYRMRADAHYVDQLSGPRAGRRTDTQKAESRVSVDPERFHAQLAEDLATIQGAATLLASDPTAVARQVSLDLIRHQAWRAAWLLRAQAILEGGAVVRPKARRLGVVLTQMRDVLAPECRLTRAGLEVHASDWGAAVDVDEPLVLAGVTGAVIATLGIIGQTEWAVLRLSAVEADGQLRKIDIAQEEVGLEDESRRRFFDPAWPGRPGGWTAGIGAATARAVAALLGGEAALDSNGRRGTRLTLTFAR